MPAPVSTTSPDTRTIGQRTKELLDAGVPVERIKELFFAKTGRNLEDIPDDWPLAKAQAGDLPAESIDLPEPGTGTTVAKAGARQVPYKDAYAPTAKLSGILKGVVEAGGEMASEGMALLGDELSEAVANLTPFYTGPVTKTRGGPLARHVKERKEEIKQKGEQPFIKALTDDVSTTMSAIPAAAASLAEGVLYPASIPADAADADDGSKYLERQGREFGKNVARGMVADTALMALHPLDTARAEPFQTALSLVPEARGAAGLVLSTKAGQKLAKAAKAAKLATVGDSPVLSAIDAAGRALPFVDKAKGPITERAGRMFIDSTYSRDPVLRDLLVETTHVPTQTEAGIKKLGERVRHKSESGRTTIEPVGLDEAKVSLRDAEGALNAELARAPKGPLTPSDRAAVDARIARLTEDRDLAQTTLDSAMSGRPTKSVRLSGQETGSTKVPSEPVQPAKGLRTFGLPDKSPYDEMADAVVGPEGLFDRQSVLTELDHVIHNELGPTELLRIPEIRKAVANELRGVTLPKEFERHLKDLVEFQPGFKPNIPIHPLLKEALNKAVASTKSVKDKAIEATINSMAEQAGKRKLGDALTMEGRRLEDLLETGSLEVSDWKGFDTYALKGDHGAMIRRLDEMSDSAPDSQSGAAIKKQADRLRTFKQLDARLTGSDAWVDPVLHDAITTNAKAKNALKEVTGVAWVLGQVKKNLTARNVKSSLNNIGSNILLQAIRTGDPLGGIGEVAKAFTARRELGRWTKGTIDSDKWRELAKTGLFDSTALDQDIAQMASLPHNQAMEAFYKGGDNFFKAGEASQVFDNLSKEVAKLEPDDWIDIPDQSGRLNRLHVRQGANGLEYQLSSAADPNHLRTISPTDLPRLYAHAAAKAANDLFFDYGQTPKLAQILRYQPALGLLSPFYAWSIKAIDLPGKPGLGTQAILGRPTYRTNSSAVLRSQALDQIKLGARRAMLLGGLRADLEAKNSQELLETTKHLPNEIKLGLARIASDPNYIEVARMGNWNFLNPSLDFFKLLASGAQAVGQGADATEGGKKRLDGTRTQDEIVRLSESLKDPDLSSDPETLSRIKTDIADLKAQLAIQEASSLERMKARQQGTGQLGGLNEVLNLIGMAGSPLVDFIDYAKTDQEYGKDVSIDDAMRQFGAAALGGTVSSLQDIAVATHFPGSRWSSYRFNADPATRETVARFIIRKLTGMGWQRVSPQDTDKWFDKAAKEWKASLGIGKFKREFESAKAQGDTETASRLYEIIGRAEAMIDEEIGSMREDFHRMKDRLGFKQDQSRGSETY